MVDRCTCHCSTRLDAQPTALGKRLAGHSRDHRVSAGQADATIKQWDVGALAERRPARVRRSRFHGSRLIVPRASELAGYEVPVGVSLTSYSVAFSPDGQWVAYVDGLDIKKVRADGGSPLTVGTL